MRTVILTVNRHFFLAVVRNLHRLKWGRLAKLSGKYLPKLLRSNFPRPLSDTNGLMSAENDGFDGWGPEHTPLFECRDIRMSSFKLLGFFCGGGQQWLFSGLHSRSGQSNLRHSFYFLDCSCVHSSFG